MHIHRHTKILILLTATMIKTIYLHNNLYIAFFYQKHFTLFLFFHNDMQEGGINRFYYNIGTCITACIHENVNIILALWKIAI